MTDAALAVCRYGGPGGDGAGDDDPAHGQEVATFAAAPARAYPATARLFEPAWPKKVQKSARVEKVL
jgi:hypothetical protein